VIATGKGWCGVVGISESTSGGFGVYGENTAGGTGVVGVSKMWMGVYGESQSTTGGAGVCGKGKLAGLFQGDVIVTGDIQLTNADCAEHFNIGNDLLVEPGTVMVVGGEGALFPSQQAYDKRVAGVVSGAGDYKPGVVLDKQQSESNRQPIALLGKGFDLSFWMLLPLAGIFAAFWGILLGFPVLRLRGDYLAIVTLAFGEIIRLVLINWVDLTNGYAGISGIPRPAFFGIPFTADDDGFAATFGLEFSPLYRTIFLYYLILGLALLTAFVTIRLRRLPIGRAWEALREDEIACRSLGINTTNTKLTAFAIGAMFAGFAGSFFAARQGFISPESFTFLESATILAIVVLGGLGSQVGVAIAAIVMIGGTELLRELDALKAVFGPDFDPTQYRMLVFGFAMVAIMVWRPRGLISARAPSLFLRERKAIAAGATEKGRSLREENP